METFGWMVPNGKCKKHVCMYYTVSKLQSVHSVHQQLLCRCVCAAVWIWWASARPSVLPLVNEAFVGIKWGCRSGGHEDECQPWRELPAVFQTLRSRGQGWGQYCGKQDFKMLIGQCQPHLQELFRWYRQSCEACIEPLSEFSISGRPSGTARHYCSTLKPNPPYPTSIQLLPPSLNSRKISSDQCQSSQSAGLMRPCFDRSLL